MCFFKKKNKNAIVKNVPFEILYTISEYLYPILDLENDDSLFIYSEIIEYLESSLTLLDIFNYNYQLFRSKFFHKNSINRELIRSYPINFMFIN